MSKFRASRRRRLFVTGAVLALTAAGAQATTVSMGDFRGRIVKAHNSARASVGAPAVTWDPGLETQAAQYAAVLARRNVFEHSTRESRGGTGENLWMGTRAAFSLEEMFEGWQSEKSLFRSGIFPAVSSSGSWHDVGHYTQIVWPQTRKVGCAVAGNGSSDFLVCRYWPAGNVRGQPVVPFARFASNLSR